MLRWHCMLKWNRVINYDDHVNHHSKSCFNRNWTNHLTLYIFIRLVLQNRFRHWVSWALIMRSSFNWQSKLSIGGQCRCWKTTLSDWTWKIVSIDLSMYVVGELFLLFKYPDRFFDLHSNGRDQYNFFLIFQENSRRLIHLMRLSAGWKSHFFAQN